MAAAARVVQASEVRSARVESLRALAAMGVLVGHVFGVTVGFGAATFGDRLGLAGGYGVWLFFALSGYLLFWPFVKRDYLGAGTIDLRRYALNRALRILPLYYVVVIVLLVVNEGGGSLDQWWRFATFTQSFFSDTVTAVDGPMWSLVIELQFYALLPVLAWILIRASRGSIGAAAALTAMLGAASFALWYVKVHRFGAQADLRWRYSLPATFLAFTPGMLLALARSQVGRIRLPRWMTADAPLLASVPVWVLAVDQIGWAEPLSALAAALVLASVVLPLPPGVLTRALDWRPLAMLGVASYSLYLWHLPIVTSLDNHLGTGFLPLLAIAVPTCVAVALASYRLVERPFLSMRRRWEPTRPTGLPASAEPQVEQELARNL
jgi:peptidoglycan/LPS O-acetylase OafA/YrhL